MSFLSLLTLIFIALKLTSVIAWSWWLVLLPLYGGVVVVLIISVVGLIAVAAFSRDTMPSTFNRFSRRF
jgi:hypothetical protein